MTRYYTEVRTYSGGQMPYHFICNYCGNRNDKQSPVFGMAERTLNGHLSKEQVGQSLYGSMLKKQAQNELVRNVDLIRKQTDNYAEWLRTGKKKKFDGENYEDYTPKNLSKLYRYVRCDYCEQRQAWGLDPKEEIVGKKNAFIIVWSFLLGIVLMLFSLFWGEDLAFTEDIPLLLACLCFLGSTVYVVVVAIVRYFRNRKRIANEPNDPDKLPIPDLNGAEVLHESEMEPIKRLEELKNYWICGKCKMKNKNSSRTCIGCGAEK